jgi:VCBS repeat-containing protein
VTASDTLTITDADTSDNPVSFNDVAATLGDNGYGNFEITGNTWTYTLNNGHASVQALDAGESLNDTYTFTASDGSTQTVTVTINGSEDAPVIGGVATGTVTEDGTLTASDTLTITDADTSDNPVSFNDVAATLGNNGYGNFEITGNTWTYTLNNGHASVQALDAGETLTDTYTFTASDGSTQTVTVTINGAEDMPTVDNAIADQSATEDLAFNFVFAANSFGDLDASDTLTYTATLSDDSPLPAWLSFDSATRTFSGTPANGDVGAIDIKVTADDGSSTVSDVFTLTVINSSDAPVIGGVDSGAVTEDVAVVGGNITASDSLTIADPDAGESSFIAATVNGSYGDLTIDSAGNWSYSADNSQVSIQALDAGESLTDTLTVTTFDGSTHDIVITINGAEDAAVIGGTAVGGVAEDGSLTVTDTLTITDVDTSDNPVSFNDVAATIGDNGYGDFEITGNSWTYTLNNGHASVQALDVGETLTDTYTFTASDGSTQTVTVTIDGAEDAPVLGGGASGNVTEDGVLIDGNTLTITDADSSDNPVSFNDVAATLGDNGYGNFEITSNTWTYTLNNGHASVQALDAGETLTDTYTFAASDGSTRTVTVTINGSEDAAVIGGTATGTVAEDGTPSASDTLTITDADTSDNPVSFNDVAATLGDNGYGNFEITGNTWTYTLNNGHASVQALDAGESLNDTYTFTASDGSTQTVTVTINGAEDAPVIGGVVTGAVAEDGTLTASDTLTITDVDTSDNPVSFNDVAATLGDNGYGNFEISGNSWSYTLNNGHASVQALDAGESLTDTYTFAASDGSTQTVTVTINGSEDAPVIGGTATGTVAEDGTLTASDTLTITDADASDNPVSFTDVAATLGDNGYGNFEISSNTWTYTLNNGHASVQALDAGESLTDTYTFTASDGSTRTVTVTINGAEDAPVIGGVATGTVAEDGTLTASDTLTITDADSSDNPISFNDVAATLGDNGYGDFEITGNTWTYTLNNAHASVQALDAGETLTDSYTFTASDGSTRTVTVTINGAEDSPVIGGVASGTVTEDGVLIDGNTLSITDVDSSDNPVSFNDVAATLGDNGYGNFEITSNTWTYTLNNGHASVQALDAGETLIDTYTFTASDGSTQTVTVTINGSEDAPVIGGVATGTVAEDGTLTASDTLTITDADASDNPVSFNDVAATLGDNGYGNFEITGNTWTYTLNNGHAAVQALDAGETLTDTYTFTASDGSTQTVTVTINGAEDMPTVDNAIADQSATEDVAFNFVFAANSFGDLDASDTLTYTATLSDDSPLPAWLSFDSATRTFSGTPANGDVGAIDIKVTADDGSSTVSDVFTLTVINSSDAPVIGGVDSGAVTEDVGVIGGVISTTGSLTIADPDAGESSFQPATVNGSYGDLTIDSAGNWMYSANNGQAALQSLDAGESLTDTLTVTTFDGTTHDITITLNGSEDAAVLGGVAAGNVAEDGSLSDGNTLTITDADASDNPVSFNDVAATLGDNGYGNFEITGNAWTYTLNNGHAAVQALDAGESLLDSFSFTASDGSTRVVTVTIDGAEDLPVLGGITTGTVNEDGTLIVGNTLTITDTDASDNPIGFTDVAATLGDNGYGNFEISGNSWTYTLNNGHAAVQALDVGETLTDSFTFGASDGSTQTVTVTINGAEDLPVIGGVVNGSVAEDGALTVSDTLTITDADTSDNPVSFNDVAATLGDNGYGNFEIIGNSWTYTLNNGHAAVQGLDVGETLNDSYTFTASDGSTQTVTVTIDGAEDAPLLGGVTTGSVTEDGVLTASDTLTITDADGSDYPLSFNDVAATPGDNGYGNFEITGNTWTYTLNNGHAAVQGLDVGETLNDSYTFTASDGSTQTVTVTINGAEDAPVLGGVASGSVAEDGVLAAGDTLTITDADASDNPVSFNDVAPTLGDNGYGSFEMTGNTWAYALNNGHAAVQGLDVGETLTDSFTFTASDGSTQTVTVTINGAEDAPTLDNAIADQGVTEGMPFNFSFAANTFGDLDASDTLTYSATLADSSPSISGSAPTTAAARSAIPLA